MLSNEEFWKTVKPFPDAIKYLKKLKDEGYTIYFCTSTHYNTIKMKCEIILKEYFPFIDWNHTIIAKNKQMIKCDYLIDDGVHNLIGGSYKKLLFSRPHNEKFNTENTDIIRVRNWEEIYNIINNDYLLGAED